MSRTPRLPRLAAVSALVTVVALAGACSSSSKTAGARGTATTTRANGATTSTSATGSTTGSTTAKPRLATTCANPGGAPAHYTSVVVFAFENRTWSAVGDEFAKMPYLHGLATACSSFPDWTETDTTQTSLTQYVGQVTGARQPGAVDDCSPSAKCSTTGDNIFRQARRAGLRAVNYVEGATGPCSAAGNAERHVPALYMWGADDRAHCGDQVRPLRELDVNQLPAFAFVTPTLCNDGHDCDNAVVDGWAHAHVQPVIDSPAYRAGKVAVFIWYDEDHPVPNLWIAPTAKPGSIGAAGAGYAGTLAAWESMLGLPCLANACTAADMRGAANA